MSQSILQELLAHSNPTCPPREPPIKVSNLFPIEDEYEALQCNRMINELSEKGNR